jgi:hypothetical protein
LYGFDQLTVHVRQSGLRPPRIVSVPASQAAVGVAFAYDADGIPTAQGDRPVLWSVGKQIGASRVNVPAGMQIDPLSGVLAWTPTADQLGEQRVTLVATNIVDSFAQDFTVVVSAAPADPGSALSSGCSCRQQSAGVELLFLAAAVLWRGARRRAQGQEC